MWNKILVDCVDFLYFSLYFVAYLSMYQVKHTTELDANKCDAFVAGMMQQIKDEVEVSDVSEVELRYSDSEVEEKKILQIQIKEEVNDVLEGPVHNDYTAEYKNNFIKMPPIEICENQVNIIPYWDQHIVDGIFNLLT